MSENGTGDALASLKQERTQLRSQLQRVEKAIQILEPDAEPEVRPKSKPKRRKRRSKEEAQRLKDAAAGTALAHPMENPTKIHQRMMLDGLAKDTPADASLIKQEMMRMGYRKDTGTPTGDPETTQGEAHMEIDANEARSVFG